MINTSPVFVDTIALDVFVPGKDMADRDAPVTGFGVMSLPIELTVRNLSGGLRDMSDVTTATVEILRGDGGTISKSGTVSGSVVSCTLGVADMTSSTAYDGDWFAAVELDLDTGAKLFSNRRRLFELAYPY